MYKGQITYIWRKNSWKIYHIQVSFENDDSDDDDDGNDRFDDITFTYTYEIPYLELFLLPKSGKKYYDYDDHTTENKSKNKNNQGELAEFETKHTKHCWTKMKMFLFFFSVQQYFFVCLCYVELDQIIQPFSNEN